MIAVKCLVIIPISCRVNKASASKTADSASIPGRVKPRLEKLVFTASLLDVQQLKKQFEASIKCGRQIDWWQLDSKTERCLRCLLLATAKLSNLVNNDVITILMAITWGTDQIQIM